jgi:hypothetical protein
MYDFLPGAQEFITSQQDEGKLKSISGVRDSWGIGGV